MHQGLQSGGRLSGYTDMRIPRNVAAWSKIRVFMLQVPYPLLCAVARREVPRLLTQRVPRNPCQKFADDLGQSELFLAFFVLFGLLVAIVSVTFVVLPRSVRCADVRHALASRRMTSCRVGWRGTDA